MISEETRKKMREAHARRIARGEKFGFQKGHPNYVKEQTPQTIARRVATFKKNYIPKPKPSCEVCGTELWKWKDKRCRVHADYSFRLQHKPFTGAPRNENRYRKLVAKVLGRPLMAGWQVHHINENPSDDRPENLFIFRNRAAHKRWHNYIWRHKLPGTILESNLLIYKI